MACLGSPSPTDSPAGVGSQPPLALPLNKSSSGPTLCLALRAGRSRRSSPAPIPPPASRLAAFVPGGQGSGASDLWDSPLSHWPRQLGKALISTETEGLWERSPKQRGLNSEPYSVFLRAAHLKQGYKMKALPNRSVAPH